MCFTQPISELAAVEAGQSTSIFLEQLQKGSKVFKAEKLKEKEKQGFLFS